MPSQSALEIMRSIIEQGFGQADLAVIDRCIGDSFIEHQFGAKNGKEGIKQSIRSLQDAFSELSYILVNHCANDREVWAQYRVTGKQTGIFMGQPPTGRSFAIDLMERMIINNNQVTEHWGIPDRFALLVQLGINPFKTQAA